MTDETWADVEGRLATELSGLADGEFVILGEPQPPAEKPRGLLRRAPAPPPHRYVQVARHGDWLYAECVGATSFGGHWEVSPEQHEQIRALGWLAPGDPDETGTQPSYPNYWRTLPGDRATEAAALGAGALQVLGVAPGALDWHRER